MSTKKTIIFTALLLLLIGAVCLSANAETTYDDNGIMFSDEADVKICTIGSRSYYKLNEGPALIGYFYNVSGYTGPILVSEVESAVSYKTSYGSDEFHSIGSFVLDGKTYYYSDVTWFMSGNCDVGDGEKLYKCGNGEGISVEDAAKELVQKSGIVCFDENGNGYKEHQSISTVTVKSATCEEAGKTQKVCTVCGKVIEEGTVEPLGHIEGEVLEDRAATCESAGQKRYECRTCGEIIKETFPIKEHSYGEWSVTSGSVIIPPIVKERTCSVCNHIDTANDWSMVWVSVLILVGAIGIIIGVINYFKAFKNRA